MFKNDYLLYEDPDVVLFGFPCDSSDFTVVTFTPRLGTKKTGRTTIESGFGYDFFKKKGIAGFYIVPKWNHWWQVPGMHNVVRVINERRRADLPLWTYGVSMGGTGALMFAALLNAEGVISINPQASVSLITADFDPRWLDDRAEIGDFDDTWMRNALPSKTWVFGDSGFLLDKLHVDLIKVDQPGINYIRVPFTGHSTIRALMESSILSWTISSLLDGSFSLTYFRCVFRAGRVNSPVVWTEASNHLVRRRSFNAAYAFSSKAMSLLENSKIKGEKIDSANAALSVMAHSSNILNIHNKDAARELLNSLNNNPVVDFDFSWHKLHLAELIESEQEILSAVKERVGRGGFDDRWLLALVRIVKAGLVNSQALSQWDKTLKNKLFNLQEDEVRTATLPVSKTAPDRFNLHDKNVFIFGPSHALRWSIHARCKVVECIITPDRIIGWGGAPIWNKKLFQTAEDRVDESGRLVVFVGDFLFGNKICKDSANQPGSLMQDGFLGIDPSELNTVNNAAMLERGIKGVRAWHQQFGRRARFIFWCLFGRQVMDRAIGRHVHNNEYKHPTFNYVDVADRLRDINIIDLSPLLKIPAQETLRLFIDGSANPSQIGYLLLNNLLAEDALVTDAYNNAVAVFEAEMLAIARATRLRHQATVLLTGRSIWLDTFARYMGSDGADKLANEGIVLAPIEKTIGLKYSIDNLPQGVSLGECSIFILSCDETNLSEVLAHKTGTLPETWKAIPVINWEGATKSIIRTRGETPKFTHLGGESSIENLTSFDLAPHMVELGPTGMPTWAGLQHMLLVVGATRNEPVLSTCGYRIEGGVLLSKGVAFLVEGNHSVLKYATGSLRPTEQSISNFVGNLHKRTKAAHSASVPYAHVIFPDKQSVLDEVFPFKPIRRLGADYLDAVGSTLCANVIYPLDALKSEEHSFWPMDTHLTDRGSLIVLEAMLKAVGVEASSALQHIERRINKPVSWSGDLGNKLKPPLKQDGVVLDPDWEPLVLRNNVGFNDGLIDILINPKATYNCTLLLFGDSFFRMMLQHLSAIFSRVICLRTRFMHEEMISLIKPDFMFTGNAERYLSHVASDTEATAFYLYPYMREGCDLSLSEDFLEAWAAITSPGSVRYNEFLKKHW